MKKIICCPPEIIPNVVNEPDEYFSLYSSVKPKRDLVGHIAIRLKSDLRKAGIRPPTKAWDFTTIALSVAAADMSVKRSHCADGWTRQIELDVYLNRPEQWIPQKAILESTFRFLSGDFWKLNFLPGGEPPPDISAAKIKSFDATCVSLLSGGVDSLIGAVDLVSNGEKPLFVSKIATGDKDIQSEIAHKIGAENRHLQWSYARRSPRESETSTRARSIIFFAYAILAASAVESQTNDTVQIYVPENGFISLNLALNPGRMGTLSTKTTHPVYLGGLQKVMDAVGINVSLQLPYDYQFKTKGELLKNCLNKRLLTDLLPQTTSCGRYLTYKRTHCGRCIPCLVRRAAFIKSGFPDCTAVGNTTGKQYMFKDLSVAGLKNGANDIGAAATAYLRYKDLGIERFIGGALAFAPTNHREQYVGVVKRGLEEIGQLLLRHNVL